ncbi:myosin-11-like [Carica papaya]|uniref:myosin-11-like n=1 Tax=Carica papaya TaxID=3649 RepID=UPI000B8CAF39|nr:myosin-11-like [Carica papaya]
MAKKKVTTQINEPREQPQSQKDPDQDETISRQTSMEELGEKLQNLKSLNSLLAREVFEKRQQIDSLGQAKNALQRELARSKGDLEAELGRASDENAGLELEKLFFCVAMETYVREMCAGIDCLVREKEKREREIMLLKGEVNELMENFENLEKSWGEGTEKQQDMATEINPLMEEKREMESRIKKLIEQTSCITKELEMTKMESDEKELLIEDLSREKNELLERKEDNDNVIELVRREKDKLEMNLEEKLKEIQDLHGEIEGIAREKEKIQMENDAQKLTINDLEKELRTLNEILLNSRKEEEMLSGKVFELEKSWGEGMEKQQDMTTEINALMEEKREMESCIAKLVEQMDCMTKDLEMTKTESDEKARLIEDLSREKNELEGLKLCTENEVAELHGEVGQLRDVVIRLQESCQNQEEQNKQLKSEVGHFKDAFDRVTIEKVDALKSVDEERKNGLKLMSEVSEVEKKIEETRNELARVKSEHDIVFEEKKGMERHFELLKKEKDSMQMKLSARVSEIEKSTEGTKKELARVRSECENLFGEKKELESRFELLREEKDSMQMKLSAKVSEMEKMIEETRKELAERRSECKNVFEEKKELEFRFELLRKEKDSMQMKLSAKVYEMEKRVEESRKELARVRSEQECVFEGKKELESHFDLLRKEKDSAQMKLSAKVSEMEKIIEETRKELARVRGQRESVSEGKKELESCFELLKKEKDSMQMKLSAKVSGMEKRIEETSKELARVRSECETVLEEKKELESRYKLLRKDKDSVQKELSEAKQALNKLRAKLESVGMNSEQALTMLKNTAAVLCQSGGDCDYKDNVVTGERKLENETEQYASELEAIKKAFRHKETMVEDMKQQVGLLQNCVADAHKKKSFWTVGLLHGHPRSRGKKTCMLKVKSD